MKKLSLILTIITTSMLFGEQCEDCGLKELFAGFTDRVYCEAESSGSSEKIDEILQNANREFNEKLDKCTPSEDSTDQIMHTIAFNGTPEMLYRFAQTEHFKGFDYMSEEVGGTPLMSAAYSGNIELVKALLEKGADPSREVTREVEGEQKVMTPQVAALKIPEAYSAGGMEVMGILGTIISRSARYQKYPYDGEMMQKLGSFLSPLAPFLMCEKLIRDAQEQKNNNCT